MGTRYLRVFAGSSARDHEETTMARGTAFRLLGRPVAVCFALGASAVGKSVIVHKEADDFKTQPTGNCGARVVCGVITKS
jgi:Cu/Zn superoxide dismutase